MKRSHTARFGLLFVFALLVGFVPPAQGVLRAQVRPDAQGTLYLPLIMQRYTAFPSIFGVRMQAVNDPNGLSQALEARVRTVRSVTFAWSSIEPVRTSPNPTYRWWMVDEGSLINAADNQLEVIGNIHWTPDWAQLWPGIGCGPMREDQLGAFAQFLQALVSRYGQHPYHVRHWAIWNEPDIDPDDVRNPSSTYGCWGDEDDPYYGGGRYAEMLKVAYPAIKATDPLAEVIVGGLLLDSPIKPSSQFAEGILQAGGGPYFDVLAFNAYTYYQGAIGKMRNPNWPGSVTAVPDKVLFLRTVLDQYGFGEKPLMATEASMVWWNVTTPEFLETQAMYVTRVYAEALSLGLEGLIYYSMTDDWLGRSNGLLRTDLSKKPSYYAYQTATSFLAQAHGTTPVSGYPVGIEGYASLLPNSGHVDAIWSADGTPRTVHLPADASAYDRYGTALVPPILVDYGPVYVVRP